MRNPGRFIPILLMMSLLLAACGGAKTADVPLPAEGGEVSAPAAPEQVDPAPDASESEVDAPEEVEPESEPIVVEEPRVIRADLTAPDPTTVTIPSGEPTLVEFFAFW